MSALSILSWPQGGEGKSQTMSSARMADTQEETNYSKFEITNGYGMLAKAGAEATKGVKVDLDVTFEVRAISRTNFTEWLDNQKSHYDELKNEKLEENHAAGGLLAGALAGSFGLLFGAGTYNHYKNKTEEKVTNSDSSKDGFLRSLSQVSESNIQVKGEISIVGLSNMPSTGCVFVEATTIKFEDGTTKTVIDTDNPIIADETGDTTKFKTDGEPKLKIVDLN